MNLDMWIDNVYPLYPYRNVELDFEECNHPESNLGEECNIYQCPKICMP